MNDNTILGIEKVAESTLKTQYYGPLRMLCFRDLKSSDEILVFVIGDPKDFANPLVRIHSRCVTSEVFSSLHCDCAQQLEESINLMKSEKAGIVIYLDQEGRGLGLCPKLVAYELYEKQGIDTVDAYLMMNLPIDNRDYTGAINIIKYFGVTRLRLLTNNPKKVSALEDQGLIVERVMLEIPANAWSKDYLQTKKNRMGHLLKDM